MTEERARKLVKGEIILYRDKEWEVIDISDFADSGCYVSAYDKIHDSYDVFSPESISST